ncbi:unnamed protein product [Diatraea saccharalis]|uniref:CCHC-type domain-containing protein n=1 Tax=Diatraea saccharalis TaxID=40085 RepID=A0A9N9QZM9_9NEOP|nr:unnamed protein product [Diatraea saccharalis]
MGKLEERSCRPLSRKKKLSDKLTKAALYSSDSADSYCEYAREKLRLLRCTKISFTEPQLIELISGGVRDANVRITCLNSSVTTTSELITLFSSYVKQTRKRSSDFHNNFGRPSLSGEASMPGPSNQKRFKIDSNQQTVSRDKKRCYNCGEVGHVKAQCSVNDSSDKTVKIDNVNKSEHVCTFCKKTGHLAEKCFFKPRVHISTSDSNKM